MAMAGKVSAGRYCDSLRCYEMVSGTVAAIWRGQSFPDGQPSFSSGSPVQENTGPALLPMSLRTSYAMSSTDVSYLHTSLCHTRYSLSMSSTAYLPVRVCAMALLRHVRYRLWAVRDQDTQRSGSQGVRRVWVRVRRGGWMLAG
eukprot:1699214-Rhodomonas_salina.1